MIYRPERAEEFFMLEILEKYPMNLETKIAAINKAIESDKKWAAKTEEEKRDEIFKSKDAK